MTAFLYDTHAHLDDTRLASQIDEVLSRAAAQGVVKINNIGCTVESSRASLELATKYPEHIRAVVGVHPCDVAEFDEQTVCVLSEMAADPLTVAWGEIGLDYHYSDSPDKELQKNAFRMQIEAAKSLKRPIVIHERDAHQDTMDILKEMRAGENGGVLHCFSGSWEMAKECMKLGFHIALGGPLTYKNARVPVEVVEKIPLDYLLTETDCPYLAPHPMRGQTNEPAFVAHTAARMAEIRNIEYDAFCEAVYHNGIQLFQWR